MKKEDIEHLAKLSRIALTEDESVALATDITSILGYVSEIEEIAGEMSEKKKVGALYNVMREDKCAHRGFIGRCSRAGRTICEGEENTRR